MSGPKKYRVVWVRTASGDLESIAGYIAEDSPARALDILDGIERAAEKLAIMPGRGRVVPELVVFGINNYRQLIHFPWRIIYRIAQEEVVVLAVLDSRRRLEDLLLERLVRE